MSLEVSKLNKVSQKGAKIEAQCPACFTNGSDKGGNHLVLYPDGAFACTAHPGDKEHRREIARIAGDKSEDWKKDAPGWAPAGSGSRKPTLPPTRSETIRQGVPASIKEGEFTGSFECFYSYHDSAGVEVYIVVRYRLPENSPKKKTFRQQQVIDGKVQPTLGDAVRMPYHLPDVLRGETVWIVEGEKDADNLMALGIIATCNAGGAKKWDASWSGMFTGKDIVLCPDNDAPGTEHADLVEKCLKPVAKSFTRVVPPEGSKDISDAIEGLTDSEAQAIIEAMLSQRRKSKLSFRKVSEILGMTFDDSDKFLGDRMLAAGLNSSILGPGGIGKSRLTIQMALSCITGREFLGFETFAKGRRWLFIQTENSTRRLQTDLAAMIKSFDPTSAEIGLIDDNFIIHTLETDDDAFIQLDNPEGAKELNIAIQDYKATFNVFDPLNTFTLQDLNSDQAMIDVARRISQMVKRGDPSRVPMIVHHAGTGKSGAAKAIDWDRASFGRNSKALHSWTRSQFNLASRDASDSTLLLLACGKCSDGKDFDPIGIQYAPVKGLYEIDHSFDIDTFREEMGAKKEASCTTEQLLDAVQEKPRLRKELAARIMELTGISKATAYRVIAAAEKSRKIREEKFSNHIMLYGK